MLPVKKCCHELHNIRKPSVHVLMLCGVCVMTSGHVVGRQAIVVHEVICPLARLFDDDEDIVRRNAHRAIEMISETNLRLSLVL